MEGSGEPYLQNISQVSHDLFPNTLHCVAGSYQLLLPGWGVREARLAGRGQPLQRTIVSPRHLQSMKLYTLAIIMADTVYVFPSQFVMTLPLVKFVASNHICFAPV